MFRHPKIMTAANVFISPFKDVVWYAIITICMLSAYIVRITFSIENERIRTSINPDQFNEDSNSNCMLMMFGFILQQCKILT